MKVLAGRLKIFLEKSDETPVWNPGKQLLEIAVYIEGWKRRLYNLLMPHRASSTTCAIISKIPFVFRLRLR
jgi:hypothetical protein